VTRIFVLIDGKLAGSIVLSDTIRPESYNAIEEMHRRHITCWMLTGDHQATAEAAADELGMDGFFAGVLLEEKQNKIKELQDNGEYVAKTATGYNVVAIPLARDRSDSHVALHCNRRHKRPSPQS